MPVLGIRAPARQPVPAVTQRVSQSNWILCVTSASTLREPCVEDLTTSVHFTTIPVRLTWRHESTQKRRNKP